MPVLSTTNECTTMCTSTTVAAVVQSHLVLIDRLREIGLQNKALEWFQSYVSDSRMALMIREYVSELQVVKYSVPQGSVLGPMLFNVYCLPLMTLIRKYGVSYHVYAYDTQVYAAKTIHYLNM